MLDEAIPEKTIQVRLSNKLWITTHIKTQIKARQVIYPIYPIYITVAQEGIRQTSCA